MCVRTITASGPASDRTIGMGCIDQREKADSLPIDRSIRGPAGGTWGVGRSGDWLLHMQSAGVAPHGIRSMTSPQQVVDTIAIHGSAPPHPPERSDRQTPGRRQGRRASSMNRRVGIVDPDRVRTV